MGSRPARWRSRWVRRRHPVRLWHDRVGPAAREPRETVPHVPALARSAATFATNIPREAHCAVSPIHIRTRILRGRSGGLCPLWRWCRGRVAGGGPGVGEQAGFGLGQDAAGDEAFELRWCLLIYASRIRWRRSGKPARPYIWRFNSLTLVWRLRWARCCMAGSVLQSRRVGLCGGRGRRRAG